MDILHPTVKLGDKEQIGDKSRDPHPSLSVHVVIECPPFPHFREKHYGMDVALAHFF